jgi:cytochrome c nitrite reductase small subunit
MKPRQAMIAGIGALFLFIIVTAGVPLIIRATSTPAFCNLCHVMNYEYDAWFHTGLHRSIKCVDCHLPNNNLANHLVWKGIDGTKDVLYFYSRLYAEQINISNHGAKVLKSNCIRCHENMVSFMNTSERNCWDCHRRVNHKVAEFAVQETKK